MAEFEKVLKEEAVISFLTSAIDKTNSMIQHIDDQINILVGISTAVFVFSTTRVYSHNGKLIFTMLGIFSVISAIIGLFGLHPPKFMRKKGQQESVIFPSYIATFNEESYSGTVSEKVKYLDKITDECSRELYNMSKYYYVPKRMLYKYSRNVLLAGIIISLFLFIVR